MVEHSALDAGLAAFLRKSGAQRFPYEQQVRDRLREAVAKLDEVKAEEWLADDAASRLQAHLLAVLERGAFEARDRKTGPVHRSVYSIEVSGEVRRRWFALSDCQRLFAW